MTLGKTEIWLTSVTSLDFTIGWTKDTWFMTQNVPVGLISMVFWQREIYFWLRLSAVGMLVGLLVTTWLLYEKTVLAGGCEDGHPPEGQIDLAKWPVQWGDTVSHSGGSREHGLWVHDWKTWPLPNQQCPNKKNEHGLSRNVLTSYKYKNHFYRRKIQCNICHYSYYIYLYI
jgi:hypothetical protein